MVRLRRSYNWTAYHRPTLPLASSQVFAGMSITTCGEPVVSRLSRGTDCILVVSDRFQPLYG